MANISSMLFGNKQIASIYIDGKLWWKKNEYYISIDPDVFSWTYDEYLNGVGKTAIITNNTPDPISGVRIYSPEGLEDYISYTINDPNITIWITKWPGSGIYYPDLCSSAAADYSALMRFELTSNTTILDSYNVYFDAEAVSNGITKTVKIIAIPTGMTLDEYGINSSSGDTSYFNVNVSDDGIITIDCTGGAPYSVSAEYEISGAAGNAPTMLYVSYDPNDETKSPDDIECIYMEARYLSDNTWDGTINYRVYYNKDTSDEYSYTQTDNISGKGQIGDTAEYTVTIGNYSETFTTAILA